MAQHWASPLVQVIEQPSLVISHLHMPIVMLQQPTIRPFIIMQQEHMPVASMLQRLCMTERLMASSQLHIIFRPPLHFSTLIVHLGTIIIDVGAIVAGVLMPGMPVPMPIPVIMPAVRSIIIVDILPTPSSTHGPGRFREYHRGFGATADLL
jgi:hypothetical protein